MWLLPLLGAVRFVWRHRPLSGQRRGVGRRQSSAVAVFGQPRYGIDGDALHVTVASRPASLQGAKGVRKR